MDPTSIHAPPGPAINTLPMPTVPAAVPFTGEPNNHPVAANPPAPIPQPQTQPQPQSLNHPPYAEMIYTAIEALKEKNGSSKRAIAKYIEQVYKDQLPPTHSALLTHHLKRLKNNGMLQMVKKSYKLPRSASASAATPLASTSETPQAQRPRGRPRKAQAQVQAQHQPQNFQPQPVDNVNVVQQSQNAEPDWAALGLADEPQPVAVQAVSEVKRRPGRPRVKTTPVGSAGSIGQSASPPGRRGRPPGSRNKKRPGRPPKTKPETAAVPGAPKRRPGRPPKNQPQPTPIPFAAPAPVAAVPELQAPLPAGGDVPGAMAPRRRGRPKKNAVVAAVSAVGPSSGRGRGRGRGRGGGGRGRGRGRGGLTAQLRSPIGRPVGRPRKGTTAISSQNAANEDLRRKLEHFQSKVKESLAVLKPHFNHESPVFAIAAIQELEVLGTMDLNAPLRDETPAQQQQQPPQQQPLQQQQQPPPQQQQIQPQQQQLLPQPQLFQPQFPQFHLQQYHQQQQQQPPPPPQQYQQQQAQPQYQHQHQPPHQQLFHP